MRGYTKTLFPSQYLQGAGVIKRLAHFIESRGGLALAIISPPVYDSIAPLIQGCADLVFSGDRCTLREIERLKAQAEDRGATVIVGCGGGNTLDLSKAIADGLGLPLIVCPTTAASDAPCSSVAMINDDSGRVVKVLKTRRNPDIVVVDTEILLSAPLRHLSAGMADCLSTWFEAQSCEASESPSVCGGDRSITTMALAELSYKTIMQYGAEAFKDAKAHRLSKAFDRVIEANILLSGVGFESSGIAAPHALGNTMSVLDRAHGAMHGEKVGFGILVSLFLRHADEGEIKQIYEFFKSVSLPVTLKQLGLEALTEPELEAWMAAACSRHEFLHNEPFEITEPDVRAAICAADEYGRRISGE